MFCRKCGSELEEGARFCGECGTPVVAASNPADFDPEKTMVLGQDAVGNWPEAVPDTGSERVNKIELRWDEQPMETHPEVRQGSYQTEAESGGHYDEQPSGGMQEEIPVNPTYKMILKIFAGIMAVIFAIYTVSNAFSGVFGTIGGVVALIGSITSRYGSSFYTFILLNALISSIVCIVTTVGALFMLITMISVLAGWTQEKAPEYALVTIPAGLIMIVSALFKGIVALIFGGLVGGNLHGFVGFGPLLIFCIIAIAGMFILTMMMGFNPMAQITSASDLFPVMKFAVVDVIQGFSVIMQGIGKGKNKGTYAASPAGVGVNDSYYVQTQPVRHLNTDRGLAKYIILSLITCGIYSLIMMHGIAKDLNTAFEGDGEETPGIWMYILLSLLTCGIYAFLWMFWTGNRIAKSGKKMYGLNFEENGTTLIIWDLLSATTCGIGGFMMWYLLLKNTNAICRAYNEKNRI